MIPDLLPPPRFTHEIALITEPFRDNAPPFANRGALSRNGSVIRAISCVNLGGGSRSGIIPGPSPLPLVPIALNSHASCALAHGFSPFVVSHQLGFVRFGQRLCML